MKSAFVLFLTIFGTCCVSAIALPPDGKKGRAEQGLCSYSSCWPCTSVRVANGAGCGWCTSSSSCEFGTSSGPIAPATCQTSSDWIWQNVSCPGPAPTPPPTTAHPTPAPTSPVIPPLPGSLPWSTRGGDHTRSFFRNESFGSVSPNPVVRWTYSASARYQYGSLLVYGGYVIAADCNNYVSFTFLDEVTGSIAAQVRVSNYSHCDRLVVTLGDIDTKKGVVFAYFDLISSGGQVVAAQIPNKVEPQGRFLWSYTTNSGGQEVIYDNHTDSVYVGIPRAMVGINATSGKQLWTSNYQVSVQLGRFAKLGPSGSYVLIPISGLTVQTMYNFNTLYETMLWNVSCGDCAENMEGPITIPSLNMFFVPISASPGSACYRVAGYENIGNSATLNWTSMAVTFFTNQVATDGTYLWMPTGCSADNIQTLFAINGSTVPGAPVYEKSANWLSFNPIVTREYLIFAGQAGNSGKGGLNVWERRSGKLVVEMKGLFDYVVATAFKGGWVWVTDGMEIKAIQLLQSGY